MPTETEGTPAWGLDGGGYSVNNPPIWNGSGWSPPSGTVAFAGARLTGLASGIAGSDAATVSQITSGGASLDTTDNPQPLGSETPGTSTEASPANHVHSMPTLSQVGVPTGSVAMNSQKLTGMANGSAAGDSVALGQLTQWQPTIVTASGTVSVPTTPSTPTHALAIMGGGGGGGGGGGAAGGASPTATQVGGGGGGAGAVISQVIALGSNTSLTYTQGAAGSAGTGGAAGTSSAGVTGTGGGNGGSSTLTGSGISLTAPGGSGGNAGLANSSTIANAGQYGQGPNSNQASGEFFIPGSGGEASSGAGYAPGAGVGYSARGGGGGAPASATLGGAAGGSGNAQSHTGTPAGATPATAAPANSGQGGDGGGGGSYNSGTTPGAGGNGIAGGSGFLYIIWLP